MVEEITEKFTSNKKKRQPYPCSDCADTTPYFYCDACKAEYEEREQAEFERRTEKQRAQYASRRKRILAKRPQKICANPDCGIAFQSKRKDARFCSDRCRQQAHRVTDKSSTHTQPLSNRDAWERKLLALLDRHQAVFLNQLLPEERTRAQYQALCLLVAKLEAAGKVESIFYYARYGKPGFKALVKPGHVVEHPNQIPKVKAKERLPL